VSGRAAMHHASLAATAVAEDRVPFEPARRPLEPVAEYPRERGAPYRVVRDSTVLPPFGRYCVYVGARRIGSQLSWPSAEDCRRMEEPPAQVAHAPVLYGRSYAREMHNQVTTQALAGSHRPRIAEQDRARLARRELERPTSFIRTLPGGAQVKRCAGCKAERELRYFSKGTGPGGYHRHCRNCNAAYNRERRARQQAAGEALDMDAMHKPKVRV
jgi:hypothetical protein